METNQQTIGKGISYNHLLQDDKHYFGGFLNLAQNNIDNVIQEFCSRTNHSYDKSKQLDILFDQCFKDNTSHTDWERGVSLLKEYWPVISFIDLPVTHHTFENIDESKKENMKRKYFKRTLRMLLSAVNDLRNYYTHFYHAPVNLADDLFTFIDKTLFTTVIDVKKTKMKDDKTRQILKESLQKEIEKLYTAKFEELKKKKKENSRINLNDKNGIINSIYNDAFAHLIFNNQESNKEELSKRYRSKLSDEVIARNGIQISTSGLIFLLSFFLGKKEVEQLKSNIEGYKGKVLDIEKEVDKEHNSLRYMATHWVFSCLAFKGTKQRLTNSFSKESLMIQMVDELSKVPDEVYQTLSETNRKQFIEDVNEYVSDVKNEEDAPLYVIHPVIRKRYENKFSYFAIRYLDEFAVFPTLRFQVYAGQYLHDSRLKTIAGVNSISDREVKEKINIYGRLSEIVKQKNDYFENNPPTAGWELFPNPSYNWVANNIPVYINLFQHGEEANKVQIHINQLRNKLNPPKGRTKRLRKEDIISGVFGGKVKYGDPTLLLSNNELMALLYELLVNKKTGEELEKIIVDKIVERYQMIIKFEPGTDKASKSVVPDKLQKSVPGNEIINYEKLLRAIRTEIQNGENKLDMIRQRESEYHEDERKAQAKEYSFKSKKGLRKHILYTSEIGVEATWIANDLKRFMPVAARANWKGIHHSELQRLIAFYDTQKQDALNLIESVWNMQNSAPYWNSEFKKLFIKPTFIDFYKAYIKERNDVLNSFSESIKNNQGNSKILKKILTEVFIVFDKRLYRVSATDRKKEELLAKPFAFPRGLFDEKPTVVPGYKPQSDPDKFADWYVYGYHYAGKFQSFYDIEREYSAWYDQKKKEGGLPALAGKDAAHKFYRFKMSCDLQINHIKRQDIFMKLMVDNLYRDLFDMSAEFDLSALYDSMDERRENSFKALAQKDKRAGDESDNIMKQNFFWNKLLTVSLYDGRISEHNVKLKDVGKFRKFAADPKVATLISYDTTRVWTKLEIENELENKADSYEAIRRNELLKQIQQFEKYILEQNTRAGEKHSTEFETNGHPNFKKYITNGVLKKVDGISEDEIKLIRDTEFHNIGLNVVSQKSEYTQKAYLLILLRNKYGHNQLPDTDHYQLILKWYPIADKQNSYSAYFNIVTQTIIAEFKNKIIV